MSKKKKKKKEKKHKHKWQKTGRTRDGLPYTRGCNTYYNKLYEERCKCGETRWEYDGDISW